MAIAIVFLYVLRAIRLNVWARKKLFENGGADFAQGPLPACRASPEKLMSGVGGGWTPTLFF